VLLREVSAQGLLELTKLKANVDEDILATMLKDHGLILTFKGKPFDDAVRTAISLIYNKHSQLGSFSKYAYHLKEPEKNVVLYAPRERAVYVRVVYAGYGSMGSSKTQPIWHELKLPMTLKVKELSLGTVTQVMKDTDTIDLTEFVFPKKKQQP